MNKSKINTKKNINKIKDDLKDLKISEIQNILEIGAGKGDIILGLNEHFNAKTLAVIEPSPEFSEILKKRGLKLIGSSYDSIDVKKNYSNYFDLIILRHVFEHLYDPLQALVQISKLVKSEGYIYLSVPNIFLNDGNVSCHFSFPHISYFSKVTLKLLANKVGLNVIALSEFSDELSCLFCQRDNLNHSLVGTNKGKYKNYDEVYYYLSKNKNSVSLFFKRFKRIVSSLLPQKLIIRYLTTRLGNNG